MYKTRDQLLLEQRYSLIYEAPQQQVPKQTPKVQINTFGDLVKLIKGIELKRKGKQLANQATSFAVDQVIGLIPGG